MGADLILGLAVIDMGREPLWDEAERAINDADASTIEEFDVPYDGNGEPDAFVDLLKGDLIEFRHAYEGGRDGVRIEVRGVDVFITGGMSWGDSPTETYDCLDRLHRAGVLAAAGFDR